MQNDTTIQGIRNRYDAIFVYILALQWIVLLAVFLVGLDLRKRMVDIVQTLLASLVYENNTREQLGVNAIRNEAVENDSADGDDTDTDEETDEEEEEEDPTIEDEADPADDTPADSDSDGVPNEDVLEVAYVNDWDLGQEMKKHI